MSSDTTSRTDEKRFDPIKWYWPAIGAASLVALWFLTPLLLLIVFTNKQNLPTFALNIVIPGLLIYLVVGAFISNEAILVYMRNHEVFDELSGPKLGRMAALEKIEKKGFPMGCYVPRIVSYLDSSDHAIRHQAIRTLARRWPNVFEELDDRAASAVIDTIKEALAEQSVTDDTNELFKRALMRFEQPVAHPC